MMQRIMLSGAVYIGAITISAAASAVEVDPVAVEQRRATFIERMVGDHDFDAADLEGLLAGASIESSILEAMSRPAERVLSWTEYRAIFLTPERIASGAQFWRDHATAIERIAAEYGVAPEMIVGILGVETFYGRRTGRYRVLDALATLAFAYPPRATFFASELESFLLLAREEDVDVSAVLGSYAGAMGAGQFIPSSYRAYAVDGDGDGRRDLWSSWDDVLGSVANYFKRHGWRQGEVVVAQASVPAGWSGTPPKNGLDLDETVGSLRRQGYGFATDLPDATPASIFKFNEGAETEYWVGFHNFRVITRYNRSAMYALAAYQLSQAIRDELVQSDDLEG